MESSKILKEMKTRVFRLYYRDIIKKFTPIEKNIEVVKDIPAQEILQMKKPNYIVLFAIFAGNLGLHRYYKNDNIKGFLYSINNTCKRVNKMRVKNFGDYF